MIWEHTYNGDREIAKQALAGALQAECHSNRVRPVRLLSCHASSTGYHMKVEVEPIDIYAEVTKVMQQAFWEG